MAAELFVCHRCPRRARNCNGACPCLEDSHDIIAHAQAAYCPLKKYGDGIEPQGWCDVPKVEAGKALPAQPPPEFPVEALDADERMKLGDLIEAGIKSIRLDVLAELWKKATGVDCGCTKRRDFLNRISLWKKNA